MKILMTGATGFVGTKLVKKFVSNGHTVHILTRNVSQSDRLFNHPNVKSFLWNDFKAAPPLESFAEISGVIHLMGENIAAKRWSVSQKEVLRASRVDSAHSLSVIINSLSAPLDFYISASAIGIYPVNGNKPIDESSPLGHSFLASLCKDWEKSVDLITNVKRKVILRTGVVLATGGGALQKMLPPFKMGLGGPIGDGDQMMSWIHRDDLVSVYYQASVNNEMQGIYNAVAPNPVSNFDFTKALGHALHRPTLLPVPVLPLKIAFGEMSGVILDSQEVLPTKLEEKKFDFKYPTITSCFDEIFKHGQQK